VKDDHDVFAQGFCDFGLAHAQAFSGSDHEHDRHHPPGDAKHGQKRAQLMRPQGPDHIADEVSEDHPWHWTAHPGECEPGAQTKLPQSRYALAQYSVPQTLELTEQDRG